MKFNKILAFTGLLIAISFLGATNVEASRNIEFWGGWDPHTDRLVVKSLTEPGLEVEETLEYIGYKVKHHFFLDNGSETLELNVNKTEKKINKDGRKSKKTVYTFMNTKRDGIKEPESAPKKQLHIRISDEKAIQKLVDVDTGETIVKYKFNRDTGKTKVYQNGNVIKTYPGYVALLFTTDNGQINWSGLE